MILKILRKLKKSIRYDSTTQGFVVNKLKNKNIFTAIINFELFMIFYFHKIYKKICNKLKITKDTSLITLKNNDLRKNQNDLKLSNRNIFHNNILIIAELSIPQCTKYRVEQKKQMLQYLGKNVKVINWHDEKTALSSLQITGSVIFYRVPAYDLVIKYYDECKILGVTTFFDVDDLIFNQDVLRQPWLINTLSKEEFEQVLLGAKLYENALKLADYGIASTKSLMSEMVKVIQKPVYILNNAIDDETINAQNTVIISPSNTIRIMYGSGTKTHDEDFKEAEAAIYSILKKYNNVEFIIYGYLNLNSRFDEVKEQIYFVPFVDAVDYYKALANADITIAPLKSGIFNNCKSNIKYLESSIAKVPCVASLVTEFADTIINDHNGYLAASDDEWFIALEKLVLDKTLRDRIAQNAYAAVIQKYNWQTIAKTSLLPILEANPIVPEVRSKKRILMVNILFAPDSFGGATIVAENVAKNISNTEVLVFCGSIDNSMSELSLMRYEVDGIPVIKMRLPTYKNREEDYNNEQVLPVFADVVKAWQPDLVHFHSIQMLGASIALVCQELKIPYVVTLHDAWWICERQFMVMANNKYCANYEAALHKCAKCMTDAKFTHKRRFYLKDILDKANLLLAPSKFQKDLYVKSGFAENSIKVNKNGVIPVTNRVVDRVNLDNPKVRFAYLGGVAVHKGFFWLKDMFEQITESNYILKLINIEGRMAFQGAREHKFNCSQGAQIEVSPFFDQDKIDEFYAGIDVLLFPSQCKESFGLTIREALIRDVWVITTDCGGPSEDVIDGVNGNIIKFGDFEAFKHAIINILRHPEVIQGYQNPAKDKIVLIKDQVIELEQYYDQVFSSLN